MLEAETGAQARERFDGGVDLVILDYRLDDIDGLSLLEEMRKRRAEIPVIMMTAHSSIEHAVAAMQAGAFHYLSKPFPLDAMAVTSERALAATRLRRQIELLKAAEEISSVPNLVGESRAIRRVKGLIARIATSPGSTVLITGESGTGKDMASRALHHLSDRRDAAFLNITCSALPANLLESELFGHERGAFTDARTRKRGLLEHADGGTVFLDEIGEMAPPLQAKLLRFLEERAFRRVGGTEDISTDVRVVAATNVDLAEAVRHGRFREDLYYRLAVLALHLPPLREREGDVALLAGFFVDRFAREFDRRIVGISREALRRLELYPWPGNVRQLRNAVERAVLLAEGEVLGADDFSFLESATAQESQFRLPAGGVDLRDLERSLLEQALARTGGNQTRAGALLGMNRDQVRYRIERFGLQVKRS